MIEAKHRVAALIACVPSGIRSYALHECLPESHPVWADLLKLGMLDENYRVTDNGARWLQETLR